MIIKVSLQDFQLLIISLSIIIFLFRKEPFVLNLASLCSSQFELSLFHASSAIKLAASLGSPYYSIHAGFLLDVTVSELGKNLSKKRYS